MVRRFTSEDGLIFYTHLPHYPFFVVMVTIAIKSGTIGPYVLPFSQHGFSVQLIEVIACINKKKSPLILK